MNKPSEWWTWNFRERIRKPKVLEKAPLALASKRKKDKRNSCFLVRTWKNRQSQTKAALMETHRDYNGKNSRKDKVYFPIKGIMIPSNSLA